MSSVPCARERAELVRAWWVTASGSGVAICGDTGKKLDRPVPAGFETVPQGIRVNLRVRDASGITTKASNPDTRCPPCIPHPSHRSRAQARGGFGVSSSPNTHDFSRKRAALSGTNWTRLTLDDVAAPPPQQRPRAASLSQLIFGASQRAQPARDTDTSTDDDDSFQLWRH